MTAQVCSADDVAGTLGEWLTGPGRAVEAGLVEELAQATLSGFVESATRLFPAAGAAIVLYQDERPGWVTASGAGSLAFAYAEAAVGDGPSLTAARHGQVTRSDDLPSDPRWPDLAPAAVSHGVRAVLAVPINGPGHPIGVISLTAGTPSRWNDRETDAVVAAASTLGGLLQASAAACASAVLAGQLQHALDHRIVIEQAKGVLIGRMGISCEAALALLRGTARSSRRKLADVAAEVLTGQAMFASPQAANGASNHLR